MRATSPAAAIAAAQPLIEAADNALTRVTIAPAGAVMAQVDDGLGDRAPLVAAAPVTALGWPGLTVRLGVEGYVPRAAAGGTAGAVVAGGDRTPLKLAGSLREPSPLNRLTRLR